VGGAGSNTSSTGSQHTHAVSGTSGNDLPGHSHAGTTDAESGHNHQNPAGVGTGGNSGSAPYTGYNGTTGASSGHTHTFTSGGANTAHQHSWSGTSTTASVDHVHTWGGTSTTGSADHTHPVSGNTDGGGTTSTPHENMPPFAVLQKIIKALPSTAAATQP
jgi:hypothetical protein